MNRITQAPIGSPLVDLNLVNPANPVQFRRLRYTALQMTPELFKEIIATYQSHGWELKRVLMKPATQTYLKEQTAELFNEIKLIVAEFDALWFARASQAGREAWELRLVAEQPYALFEAFEADETEEEREEARMEMENKMREFVTK